MSSWKFSGEYYLYLLQEDNKIILQFILLKRKYSNIKCFRNNINLTTYYVNVMIENILFSKMYPYEWYTNWICEWYTKWICDSGEQKKHYLNFVQCNSYIWILCNVTHIHLNFVHYNSYPGLNFIVQLMHIEGILSWCI